MYGLGTGGNGIGSNTAILGYATPCQFPAANTKIKFAAGGLHTGTAIDVNGNVYFTGANEDGATGLAAVHDAGGVTIVQRPDTALAPLMALSALKLRPADWVLTLSEIAGMLGTLDASATPMQVS